MDEARGAGRRSFSVPTTLPSHIWRELVKATLLAVAVFSVVLMAVFAGQVLRDGVGPYALVRILPNFLPLICPFVLPLAIITGVIICYSRLARDNEILAAYAGGVHPVWLALPALLTSVVAIFVTLSLNESALKPAIANIERLVVEDHANILQRMLSRPGNITVQAGGEYLSMSKLPPSADGRRTVLDVTRFVPPDPAGVEEPFAWDPAYPYPAKRMAARDHLLQDMSRSGGERLILKMLVTRPVFQELHPSNLNKTFIAEGESGEERLVVGGRPPVTLHSNRSAFWPILDLSRDLRAAESDIQSLETAGKRHELSEANRRRLTELRARVNNRAAEITLRLALSFSCLAFAVLGIPLGMRSMGSLAASFGIGIVVSGVYFLILKTIEHRAGEGRISPWFIWVPDLLVLGLGLILWFSNPRRA